MSPKAVREPLDPLSGLLVWEECWWCGGGLVACHVVARG